MLPWRTKSCALCRNFASEDLPDHGVSLSLHVRTVTTAAPRHVRASSVRTDSALPPPDTSLPITSVSALPSLRPLHSLLLPCPAHRLIFLHSSTLTSIPLLPMTTQTRFKPAGRRSLPTNLLIAVLIVLALALIIRNAYRLAFPSPRLDCARPIRMGDAYGGWHLCRPLRTFAGQLVYTIGVGRNIKWDEEMIRTYGTVHHGWDPTPTASDYFSKRSIPKGFHFHKYGLASKDGNLTLKLPHGNHDSYTIMSYHQGAQDGTVVQIPVLTVGSMMRMLWHSHLAILKIDIEGAEFEVIEQWGKELYRIPADQVLIEFHERYFATKPNFKQMVPRSIEIMNNLGFDLIVKTGYVRIFSCHLHTLSSSLTSFFPS